MVELLSPLLLCLLLAGEMPAQTARVTYTEQKCASSQSLTVTGLPKLGATVSINYSGPNYWRIYSNLHAISQPILMLGVSDTAWGSHRLPWTLPVAISPSSCQLMVSIDYAATRQVGTRFVSTFHFTVPNNRVFLGQSIHAQWAVWNYYWQIQNSPPKVITRQSYETSRKATLTIGR